MTTFRPCIDLHQGQVKQIVGGSLTDAEQPKTNFVSDKDAAYFAKLYRDDGLTGGHIIQLGAGNEAAAHAALAAWPKGMQVGGGVNPDNARHWLDAGASKVIVTSYLFENSEFSIGRLRKLGQVVPREELVLDLSCSKLGREWRVATNRWQTITNTRIDRPTLDALAQYCSEFLIHAVDVEGLCEGIDQELVEWLGDISAIPCTYAGGGRAIEDLQRVAELSRNRVDLTFGSALDLFGGTGVKYADCVAYNRQAQQATS